MGAVFGCLLKGKKSNRIYSTSLEQWNRNYGESCCSEWINDGVFVGCSKNCINENMKSDASLLVQPDSRAAIEAVLYNSEDLSHEDSVWPQKKSSEDILLDYITEHGFESLKNINGDFAGAVYQPEQHNLILLRDHMGVRPLFYYFDEDIFAFSTDIRGLIALPDVDLSVNEKKLYLGTMGYNDLTFCETEYEKIKCVPPGSWMEVTMDVADHCGFSVSVNTYWKPGQVKVRHKSEKEYTDELRSLVEDSIRRRLNAVSGTVGCELSGGFDSSVIAILINRMGRNGNYFSWSWSVDDLPASEEDDERIIIRDICDQEGISCQFAQRKIEDDYDMIDKGLRALDVPYINTPFITEGSAWMHSESSKVVFSGHGGDEGVSHRCNFYELWCHREYFQYMRGIYRGTRGESLRILRWLYRLIKRAMSLHPSLREPYHSNCNMECYLNEEFKAKMKNTVKPPLQFAYDPAAYIQQGGPRVRLDNTAVQGALNGVQYIFPYLDYRVLDFALGIPRHLYQNGRGNRWIFREAFKDLMPESLRLVWRKDNASTRNLQLDHEEKVKITKSYIEQVKKMISIFENSCWDRYFDFDGLKKYINGISYNDGEYSKLVPILHLLHPYVLMQNLNDKLSEHET